ncbi:MAG: NUDIX domain-containing protein [Gemmatimonadota bacterium]
MRQQRDTAAGVIVFHRAAREAGSTSSGCRFLLLLSRLTKRPLWEFPKGGIDPGESAYHAALRELEEETGLGRGDIRVVPDFRRQESYRFTLGKGEGRVLVRKRVTYFLAEALHTTIQLSPDEASEFAWVGLDEALRRVRYRGRRRLLRAAARTVGCDAGGAADAADANG